MKPEEAIVSEQCIHLLAAFDDALAGGGVSPPDVQNLPEELQAGLKKTMAYAQRVRQALAPPSEIVSPHSGSRIASKANQGLLDLGRFELLDVVGSGGFGTVYRARDTQLQRVVAIKVPRSGRLTNTQDVDRFLREARNVAQDLTVTPFLIKPPTTSPGGSIHGDPARLDRIKASRMPKIDRPILFNTPEADAICSALEVFPPNNPWNLVVEHWPLHPRSKNIIDSIGASKPFRYNPDMGFVLVPPDQKRIDVTLGPYSQESDKGPYPVPDNTPIEGWPIGYKGLSVEEVQRKDEKDSDRHACVVDPTNRMLYEFYQMRRTDKGWQASGAAIFDLKTNKMRPDGWTSTDAAGLPIFPGHGALRRDQAWPGRARHARDGREDETRVHIPGHALRQQADRRQPTAHGRTPPSAQRV